MKKFLFITVVIICGLIFSGALNNKFIRHIRMRAMLNLSQYGVFTDIFYGTSKRFQLAANDTVQFIFLPASDTSEYRHFVTGSVTGDAGHFSDIYQFSRDSIDSLGEVLTCATRDLEFPRLSRMGVSFGGTWTDANAIKIEDGMAAQNGPQTVPSIVEFNDAFKPSPSKGYSFKIVNRSAQTEWFDIAFQWLEFRPNIGLLGGR